MSRIRWIVPAAALAALGACVVVTETETRTYDFSGFDSVSARSGVNVVLKQGPFAVSAEGPKSKLDRLSIERKGSSLVIAREQDMNFGWFGWSGYDVVTVVAPGYTAIEASGGADVDVRGLKLETLSIEASGGADVNIDDLTLDKLTASASGGADIRLSGACKTLTVDTSGGADFSGGGFRCESAIVNASGGADAEVNATASASGHASSGADIHFHGNPASLQKEESSGGDISSGS